MLRTSSSAFTPWIGAVYRNRRQSARCCSMVWISATASTPAPAPECKWRLVAVHAVGDERRLLEVPLRQIHSGVYIRISLADPIFSLYTPSKSNPGRRSTMRIATLFIGICCLAVSLSAADYTGTWKLD